MSNEGSGNRSRLVVAITGASGAVYGVRLLQVLAEIPDMETHLVVTAAGRTTLLHETSMTVAEVEALADVVHREKDTGASIASGSFRSEGMIIAPCSMKSLSAVANCYSDNLVGRAADVVLKERRRLVLVVRETPLHAGHLKLMAAATDAGAVIFPPVPAFYNHPVSVRDIVDQTVSRVLDLFNLDTGLAQRWSGRLQARRRDGEQASSMPSDHGQR